MRGTGLTRTATCRVARGIDEATGEALPARALAARVGYLATLVAECGQAVLDAHWDAASIEAICADQAPDGTRVPLFGHMAVAKLWGRTPLPEGVTMPAQVREMGAELAARQMRSAHHRVRTCEVLLAGGLPSDCPDVVSGNAMRCRIGHRLDLGEGLPTSLFDLEPDAPRLPALVPVAVCNQKFFTALTGASEPAAHAAVDADLARRRRYKSAQSAYAYRKAHSSLEEDEQPPRLPRIPRPSGAVLVLRVRLPTVSRPTAAKEWPWHRLVISIPERYQTGTCSPPTLRVTDATSVRADVAVTLPSPQPLLGRDQRPIRVLGVDWGVRRLLSATVVRVLGLPDEDGGYQAAAVDGRPLYFQPGELQGKARRIGVHRAKLQAKAGHWERLIAGVPERSPRRTELEARRVCAQPEVANLAAAQSNLNEQIARLAARWLVVQALAAGCQAIALENLKTLEHRGLGKRNNERCSLALRGKIADYTRQAAAVVGVTVLTVSARGTSSLCPRCGHRLVHLRCPGGGPGHAWGWCGQCGYSADRDHAASENVGQRAIAPAVRAVRRKPTRRRGLHPVVRNRRQRWQRRAAENKLKRRLHRAQPPRPMNSPDAASVEVDTGQAGPAAVRLVIPPPHSSSGAGQRSAGPGPRPMRQAGRTTKMHAAVPPTRLDGLLNAYRTRLRATPLLYREAPWAGAPSEGKEA